jgi:uncharacterized membrane protein YeaQ/YmgE (transglycosylase-associated protein family)
MNFIIRIILAIVVGVLVTSLLDYFGVFNTHINALLGVVAALVFYFGYHEINPRLP